MAYIIYTLALVGSFILLCEDFLDGIKTFIVFAIILLVSIFFFPTVTTVTDIFWFIFENAMYIFAALLFSKASVRAGITAGVIAAGAVILFDSVFI